MLESPLLFFTFVCLWGFLKEVKKRCLLDVVLETVFGSLLSGFLEPKMESKIAKNGFRKGVENKTNFEDDFGWRRGGPGPPRNP